MSAAIQEAAASAAASRSYTDLSLEEAVDELSNVEAYLLRMSPDIQRAQKARIDLRTMIALRMEEQGARKFERAGWRGFYVKKKSGAPSVYEAAALRAELLQVVAIPLAAIEEALPIVTVEPVVKPDLRKVRKLAEYGNDSAKIIRAHINEPTEYELLQIEPIMIDVTPNTVEHE